MTKYTHIFKLTQKIKATLMKYNILPKLYIIPLLALISFIISCKKDSLETKPTNFLKGWEIEQTNLNFDINYRDIFFINSDIGFIVGYNGNIYKTNNAGKAWQKQVSNTTLHLYSVFFLNENIGFIGGQAMNCLDSDCGSGSVFLKTTNGGETWTKTFFKDYNKIYSLNFFDESNGLALIDTPDKPNSRDYYIARTSDGGKSWKFIDLPIKPTYDKFYFIDNTVLVAGENQKIFKSTDFGNSWESISTPVPIFNDIRNIYFYNKNIGFVDGVTNFYKTTNGGLTWAIYPSPSVGGTFHFYNEKEGFNIKSSSQYEGGDFPTFKGSVSYQTFDGGASWKESELNNSFYIGLTYFPQRDLGYGISGKKFFTIKNK